MIKEKGFSLMELSISIVVIGIIAGLVMVATNLVESSKLQNVLSERQTYQNAYDLFKEKFKLKPGDFSKGSKYWGNDCAGSDSGSDLCSGDGDYLIEHAGTAAGTGESLLVWKHLELANLISGNFSGLAGVGGACSSADNCVLIGQNAPKSAWNGGGWYVISGTNEVVLLLGAHNGDSWNGASLMMPKDSNSLDNKTDDGNPITGDFRASFVAGVTLTNSGTCLDTGTTYNLDNENRDCGALFVID